MNHANKEDEVMRFLSMRSVGPLAVAWMVVGCDAGGVDGFDLPDKPDALVALGQGCSSEADCPAELTCLDGLCVCCTEVRATTGDEAICAPTVDVDLAWRDHPLRESESCMGCAPRGEHWSEWCASDSPELCGGEACDHGVTACPPGLVCVVAAAEGANGADEAVEGHTLVERGIVSGPPCWDQPATCQCCWDDNGAEAGGLRCTIIPAEIRAHCL